MLCFYKLIKCLIMYQRQMYYIEQTCKPYTHGPCSGSPASTFLQTLIFIYLFYFIFFSHTLLFLFSQPIFYEEVTHSEILLFNHLKKKMYILIKVVRKIWEKVKYFLKKWNGFDKMWMLDFRNEGRVYRAYIFLFDL